MTIKVAQIYETPGMPDYSRNWEEARANIGLVRKVCVTEEEIAAVAGGADAIICASTIQPMSRKLLKTLGKCRFIQSIGIGYEGIDIVAATESGIMVANVPDYCLEEVSDHTMALILASSRKIVDLNDAVRTGKWVAQTAPYIQQNIWPKLSKLRGMTLGLVGFGRIARSVAPKARAFGMQVKAYDPFLPQRIFDDESVEKVDMDTLLSKSDFVSLHTPLTAETKGLIGRDELRKMKPTAYLVNTGRGPLVDTKALCECLEEGVPAGAALDVVDPEPINMGNPLLKLSNVIITAHSAARSSAAITELYSRPGEEMVNVLIKGLWPRGLVNPQVKEIYRKKWGSEPSSDGGSDLANGRSVEPTDKD